MNNSIRLNAYKFIMMIAMASSLSLQAGDRDYGNPDSKKPMFGLSFNQSWTSFVGSNLDYTYFYKPSVGGHLRMEYYLKPWLGFGLAAGYQQRGAGIKSPDYDGSLGNADSTYRHRIRTNTIDIPFYLILKSPKDVIKGVRPALQLGLNFNHNFKTTDFFDSVEDGFHPKSDASDSYYVNSKPSLHTALGFDINAGTCLFQLQFIYNKGVGNVYNSPSFNGKTAVNSQFGIQFSVLY